MTIKNKLFGLLIATIFSAHIVDAQQAHHHAANHRPIKPKGHLHKKNYLNSIKATFGMGYGAYQGDLCASTFCTVPRPALQIGVNYRYNNRLLIRGDFSFIRLWGKDGAHPVRNLQFRSSNFELSAAAVYDILKFQPVYRRRRLLSPYLTGGIGILYFNPRGEYNGQWYSLANYQTEGKKYSRVTLVIPMGVGMRMKLSDHWDISLEAIYRKTFTDHLDDVSGNYVYINPNEEPVRYGLAYKGNYVPKGSSPDDEARNVTGRQRGNSKSNDSYYTLMLRAEYTIKVTKQRGHTINRVYSPKFKARRK